MQTQDGHGRAYDEEERESLWKWQTQDAHGHAYDDEEGESLWKKPDESSVP